MRKLTIVFVGLVLSLGSAAQKNENQVNKDNPFFREYKTPFQVPPFDEIKLEHFLPAIEAGIVQHNLEIEAIIESSETPDFKNTILPFDNSGELLSKVSRVFSNLNGANTNPEMQKLAREISPKMTKHGDDLSLNPELFKKIKSVYDRRTALGLDADQLRVVEKIYNDFVRGGANLSAADQAKLRTLNEALSKLSLQFGENVLAETNKNFRLVVDNKKDLDGLPGNVIEAAAIQTGIFYVANKLYGITFENRKDIPIYNPEVISFEVKEANGSHLGVLYLDFHPRDGKRAGAWCTTYRSQKYRDGKKITPVVSMVMNFTRPAGDVPALLSFDEVSTMFHEFGHALHRLLQDQPYDRTAGDVPRDFVELPSQIMENWASEPEVLKVYARHYNTGEAIPDELLAASILDMKYHAPVSPVIMDVRAFENESLEKEGLIPEILPRYRSTYFSHIFSGGYSAGYYVYIWAAVLDADAFNAFKESGDIFNPALAAKFRELLTKSGSDEGMTIYKKFRGQEPDIKSLLQRRGLD